MSLNVSLFGGSSLTPVGTVGTTSSTGLFGSGFGTTTTTTTTGGLFGGTALTSTTGYGYGTLALLGNSSYGGYGAALPGLPYSPPTQVQVGPQGVDFSDIGAEETPYPFATADFVIDDGSIASHVKIISLPANGTLTFSGGTVALGLEVPAASAPNLVYTPNTDFFGVETFSVAMSTDGSTFDSTPSTVSLSLVGSSDDPVLTLQPTIEIAEGQTDSTSIGAAILASFSDADGDTLANATITAPTSTGLNYTNSAGAVIPIAGGASANLTPAEIATLSVTAPGSINPGATAASPTTVVYEVEDSSGATASGVVNLSFTDGNDAPALTPTSPITFTLTADENSTAVTGTQAVFSDPDGDSLTYSLTGDDAALMTVDANGVVGLAAGQDYEALTAAGTNVLAATVVASDGALTESAAVSLTINDVDDTAPVFTTTAVSAAVNSTAASSSLAAMVSASETGTVTYEITGGDPDGVFAINSSSGVITVADADALDAAGAATSYTLTVSAEDGDGNAATTDVSITVDDMTPPEVTAGVTIDIDEDTPVGNVGAHG